MKSKSAIILITVLVVLSMSFQLIAYGGDFDMPVIPLNPPTDTGDTTTGDTTTGGNWETPTFNIPEPVAISKCTVTGVSQKVYTGSAIKPVPTVKYGKTTLKSGTDYKVSYKNNKDVGTATLTITGKGDYTGTKKVTFAIVPKATSLKKLSSPKKKQLKVTWKKQATQTKGYQIQYSTSSKFTAKTTKSAWVTKNATTAKTLTKLTSKKKYYVRIRTYKTVDGKKYYSAWSKSLNYKVK